MEKNAILLAIAAVAGALAAGCGHSKVLPDGDDSTVLPDGADTAEGFDVAQDDAPPPDGEVAADAADVDGDGGGPCWPGRARCRGVDVRDVCSEEGRWQEDPCPAGKVCVGEGECVDPVCAEGEQRCDPADASQVQICDETRTGWKLHELCTGGKTCQFGECVPMTCEPGDTVCTSEGQVRRCREEGTGFGDPEDCPAGSVCDGTECVPKVCDRGDAECVDSSRRRVCNYLGSGWDLRPCLDTQACQGGDCLEKICEPGARRCAPGDPFSWQQCNVAGTAWSAPAACAEGQGCLDGNCLARICEPGSGMCAPGGLIRRCNESGTAWGTPAACPGGQACWNGECGAVICTPGESTCTDFWTMSVCNDAGTGFETRPCGDGYICEGSTCRLQVCIPGMRQCTSEMAYQTCNTTGTAWTVGGVCNAGAGEVCAEGSCLGVCALAELSRSTTGCRFYAVDQHNRYNSGTYYIVVGNTHDSRTAAVTVQRRLGGTWSTVATANVAPNSVATLSPGNNSQVGTTSGLGAGYGFKITSNVPIVAYQLNAIASCTGEGSMLIPINGLDTSYYVLNYFGFSGPPLMSIIGTQDGTTVRVTPSQSTAAGSAGGGAIPAISAGTTRELNLNEDDVIQILASSTRGDLTGTYIEATAPVAVFAGTYCSHVVQYCSWCHTYDCTSCDPLEEQLIPLSAWGKVFVAPVSPEFNWGYFRLVAEQNGTTVNVTLASGTTIRLPPGKAVPFALNALQLAEFELGGSGVAYLVSDKPIMVMDYVEGGSCRTGLGEGDFDCPDKDHCPGSYADPSMILVPPVEQFLTEYVFLTPSGFTNNYVTVIRRTGVAVTLDGANVTTPFAAVGSSGYEMADVPVAVGSHHISCAQPFGIILIGYGYANSYGYPGGMSLRRINM